MDRRTVVVLGMHRSGTSALTQLLGRIGLALPATMMPASSDNPEGYFESLPIARFNKRLLQSAGTHWRDYAPVPAAWFADSAREADVEEAISLIRTEFRDAPSFVLKDPCLCRLMPLWSRAFGVLAVRWSAVLVIRRPSEVSKSLAARMSDTLATGASVTSAAKSSLMWLRHLLDAERYTRDVPRQCVDHLDLIHHPIRTVMRLREGLSAAFGAISPSQVEAACKCIRPDLHRQRGSSAACSYGRDTTAMELPWTAEGWLEGLYCRARALDPVDGQLGLIEEFGDTQDRLDRACEVYSAKRSRDDCTGPGDRTADAALAAVVACGPGRQRPRSHLESRERVLYVSGPIRSVGHELRVANGVQAWREGGHDASWCAADAPELISRSEAASRVIVFRAKWSPALAMLYARCADRGVPVHYDIDDLIFDPEVIRCRHVAFMDMLSEAQCARWELDADLFRAALSHAGRALVTTSPLAAWASRICRDVRVIANTLGPQVEVIADGAWMARIDHERRRDTDAIRIGYTSGTPSHHRDFAVVADVLARILRAHPRAVLTVVGELDVERFAALREQRPQIEVRPRVRWPDLPQEVARFDVNLAPLEPDNPFCECKSEIRCATASMVGVPTIASPTQPQRAAIIDGVTGWIATSAEEWERCLDEALSSAECRAHRGVAAREDAKLRFGWTQVKSSITIA
jgi:glycosyltransferase involved in cell wall biosynthesis